MTTIFENDLIKVSATGRDYDFIAIIDNKTDGQICIHYDKQSKTYVNNYDPILVAPNDWFGLLAGEEGRDWIKAIENNQFYVVTGDDEIDYYPTGCSMTHLNPSDVDWIIDSNEAEYNEDGNLILDHKAAFNFQVGDVIIIGFLDDFGDISRAEKFKVIKNDHKHLVCESIL